jgi:formylglycine-generating enzyme required for sulfatase activity
VSDDRVRRLAKLWEAFRTAVNALAGRTEHKAEMEGSGAIAQGPGAVAARQVAVGRDVQGDVIIIADPGWLWELIGKKRLPVDLRRATEQYLSHLVDRYRYLDFRGMGVSDRIPLGLPLTDMYVPLKARIELPEGETWARELEVAGRKLSDAEVESIGRRVSEPLPVLDLLKERDGLIILGDPGAGKTTFLKYLTLHLALGKGESLGLETRLPFLLPLSAYANALAEQDVPLDRFIARYYQDRGVDLPVGPMLEEALAQGGALLLLDGLDEVKDLAKRHLVVNRVIDFFTMQRKRGNKFILTSRIVGYKEVRPPVMEGLAECTLVDFEEKEIELFIKKWTDAIERAARGKTPVASQEAEQERTELMAAVQRNPGVRRLASNPLLLTILGLMKRQGITLPERRVELYENYVETLLKNWNLARGLGRPPSRDLDIVETVKVLAPLALWMHETNPGVGLVKQEDVRRTLETIYAKRGVPDSEQATAQFLEDIHDHAGLLVERGPREYGFIHLTFQEFLAAIAIAQQGQQNIYGVVQILAGHIGDDNWHEVSLLTIGYLGIVQQRDEAAGAALLALMQHAPGEAGQAVVLAGEAALDVGSGGITLDCQRSVIQAMKEVMTDDGTVNVSRRAAAGRVLAKLGDPRPGVGLDASGLPDIAWCDIEPGPFIMGSTKEQAKYDDERPQFTCNLIRQPYRIGRYPVTNEQYNAFVKDGGYTEQWRHCWTDAGWAWKGDSGGPKKQGGVYELPNHPVVWISWYEAVAFCNWLSEQVRYRVSLPTEAQWERAARHTDGRIYPWGNKGEPGKHCNMIGTGIGTTSAVGIFPAGNAECGAADMAGNVWEWCSTKWRENYEGYERKPDDTLDGKEPRVLRGGAFYGSGNFVRCAGRGRSSPDFRNDYVGFRVVASPSTSEP